VLQVELEIRAARGELLPVASLCYEIEVVHGQEDSGRTKLLPLVLPWVQ
jgi:hypothetical protein